MQTLSNTHSEHRERKRCEHLTYLFLKAFGGARITKISSVPTPIKAQALNLLLFVILFLQSPNFTESTNKLATLIIINMYVNHLLGERQCKDRQKKQNKSTNKQKKCLPMLKIYCSRTKIFSNVIFDK